MSLIPKISSHNSTNTSQVNQIDSFCLLFVTSSNPEGNVNTSTISNLQNSNSGIMILELLTVSHIFSPISFHIKTIKPIKVNLPNGERVSLLILVQ